MKILVTGGCGFLGSNLAAYGIREENEITVLDNLSRLGASRNLEWLFSLGSFQFVHGDTGNKDAVDEIVKNGQFDAVFHLAGQVAMTSSIAAPYQDFQVNTMGTLHILEAVRKYSPGTAVLFSSTNKVYGDLEQYTYSETNSRYLCEEWPEGFDESVPLDFHSPYGCSKGSADQYMLDYARIYGLKTVVFRHSFMYGGRQFATGDQGWIGWFCKKAIEKAENPSCAPFEISGNGKQVRDILYAQDMVQLYYTALEKIESLAGKAFNIGGGMGQSLSLLELFAIVESMLDIKMEYRKLPARISDQKVFVADITKISSLSGWQPAVTVQQGIEKMLQWAQTIYQK